MKIIGKTNSVISREERSIEPSIVLQREAKRCYFVKLYKISTKQCVPIGNFVPKSPKMSFFREKSGNRENREIFQIFNFCLYKWIYNVKIHFLSKFRWKILIFEEVMSFSIFTNLQGHWPGFTKIVVGTFQKKPVTLEVIELEPSNFAILCLIWCN